MSLADDLEYYNNRCNKLEVMVEHYKNRCEQLETILKDLMYRNILVRNSEAKEAITDKVTWESHTVKSASDSKEIP